MSCRHVLSNIVVTSFFGQDHLVNFSTKLQFCLQLLPNSPNDSRHVHNLAAVHLLGTSASSMLACPSTIQLVVPPSPIIIVSPFVDVVSSGVASVTSVSIMPSSEARRRGTVCPARNDLAYFSSVRSVMYMSRKLLPPTNGSFFILLCFMGFETKALWLHFKQQLHTKTHHQCQNVCAGCNACRADAWGKMPPPSTNKETHALPETSKKLKTFARGQTLQQTRSSW